MRGLTSLWINRGLMLTPEINPRRAAFVLGRIDEILSRERTKEQEKDVRFVELGEYLCEVRARQYWRLDNLNIVEKEPHEIEPRQTQIETSSRMIRFAIER